MLVACQSVLLALIGRLTARASLVSAMTPVSSMAAMSEHVHGEKGNGDQYPDPVR